MDMVPQHIFWPISGSFWGLRTRHQHRVLGKPVGMNIPVDPLRLLDVRVARPRDAGVATYASSGGPSESISRA